MSNSGQTNLRADQQQARDDLRLPFPRSRRLLPGWWIIPGVIVSLIIYVLLLYWFV